MSALTSTARFPRWRELGLAAAALLAVGALVYGTYVRDGGWNDDDWVWLRDLAHPFSGHYNHLALEFLWYRPAADLYILPFFTAHHMTLDLAVTLFLYLTGAVAFYVLLRTLRFGVAAAGTMAALALVFPFANAGAFWPTAGVVDIAATAYLLGFAFSLRSLETGSRRLHAVGLLLWVVSFLNYEIASFVMLVSGALYLTRAARRVAIRHWLVDLCVVVPLFVIEAVFKKLLASSSDVEVIAPTFWSGVSQAKSLATQAFSLFAPVLFPFGMSTDALQRANDQGILARVTGAWPLLGVAVLLAGLLMRRRLPEALGASLGRWLSVAAVAFVGLIASYAVFAPASTAYTPLQQGINNRVNAIAVFAWVALAFATFNVGGLLVQALLRTSRPVAPALALLAAAAVFVGYVRIDLVDKHHWVAAYRSEMRLLEGIGRTVPRPSDGTTFFVVLDRDEVAPGVRIFTARADLAGALGYRYGRYHIQALPLVPGLGTLSCNGGLVRFDGPQEYAIPAARLRDSVAIDARGSTVKRLPFGDESACRNVAAMLLPDQPSTTAS